MHARRMILLVEDNPLVAAGIRAMLEAGGWDVIHSETESGAVEMAHDGLAAAVIDIALAEGDGISTAERLRSRLGQIPILFISGHAAESDVREWLREGGALFLPKPFGTDDLFEALEALVQTSSGC
jgi:DNA-binding response OmpR family regulator